MDQDKHRAGPATGSGGGAETDPFELPGPKPKTVRRGDMLYRTLGRTGEEVSIIGLGGSHLGKIEEDHEANRLVRAAIDAGVTFMDNSWDYQRGVSEMRLGRAIKESGCRDDVFIMTKCDGRDRKTAGRQIDESLLRLRVDTIDLLQFHEVIRLEDPDLIFSVGGAAEAVLEARSAGKIRYIGFTGHKDPYVHLRMLEIARDREVAMDTIQMPLNLMDAHFRSFQRQVLPIALREEIGVLAMKTLGSGAIVESGDVTAVECLHYAMSLPVATVITGIESFKILNQALEAVKTFEPLTREQVEDLLSRTRRDALGGKYEQFKTTAKYDMTTRFPEYMGVVQRTS